MKVERTTPVRSSRAVGNAAYARRVEAAAGVDNVTPLAASANILGIPEQEFTPRVRDAIMTLMGEVDSLRRELQGAQNRMEAARLAEQKGWLLGSFTQQTTRTSHQ